MSKSENIHFTKKWKKRRKYHDADRCDNAKCGICSPHKAVGGNTSKYDKRKHTQEKELLKYEKDNLQ